MITPMEAGIIYNRVIDSAERFMLKEGLYYPSFHFIFKGSPQEIVHDHPLILTSDYEKGESEDGYYLSIVMMKIEKQEDAEEVRNLFKVLVDKYNPSAACVIVPGQFKEMTEKEYNKNKSLLLDPDSVEVLSVTFFLPQEKEGWTKVITVVNYGELKEDQKISDPVSGECERNYNITHVNTNWSRISKKLANPYPNPYRK